MDWHRWHPNTGHSRWFGDARLDEHGRRLSIGGSPWRGAQTPRSTHHHHVPLRPPFSPLANGATPFANSVDMLNGAPPLANFSQDATPFTITLYTIYI
jgi:hypothetical protein